MSRETYTGPLWVAGHPVAKGSMKCVTPHVGGRPSRLVPDARRDPDGFVGKLPDVLAWKAQALADNPVDAPVELRMDFFLARPKTTGFPEAPVGHGMGDLDKLIRQVGDAVGGSKNNVNRLITDDSRVARIVAEKHYANGGMAEGAMIEVLPYRPVVAMSRGAMPVRIVAGASDRLVGSIGSAEELPALLRRVADEFEKHLREETPRVP
jgi:hypothetical protein